jgi:HSP90 family molecular chaperone
MNERDEVGKATPLPNPPIGGSGVSNVSSSASELKKVLDRLDKHEEHLVYMTKLMEAIVNNLSLAHSRKNKASEVLKLNSQLIQGLFANKEFEGKDKFLELINKIQNMGSE